MQHGHFPFPAACSGEGGSGPSCFSSNWFHTKQHLALLLLLSSLLSSSSSFRQFFCQFSLLILQEVGEMYLNAVKKLRRRRTRTGSFEELVLDKTWTSSVLHLQTESWIPLLWHASLPSTLDNATPTESSLHKILFNAFHSTLPLVMCWFTSKDFKAKIKAWLVARSYWYHLSVQPCFGKTRQRQEDGRKK